MAVKSKKAITKKAAKKKVVKKAAARKHALRPRESNAQRAPTDAIDFKYIFSDDYSPTYANGAHGGLNSKGEIVMNFFIERVGLPYEETYELSKGGTIGERLSKKPGGDRPTFVRHVQTGVVMSLEHARTIHDWLGGHLALAEKMRGEGGNEQ